MSRSSGPWLALSWQTPLPLPGLRRPLGLTKSLGWYHGQAAEDLPFACALQDLSSLLQVGGQRNQVPPTASAIVGQPRNG